MLGDPGGERRFGIIKPVFASASAARNRCGSRAGGGLDKLLLMAR
jgi:hypothetical protein